MDCSGERGHSNQRIDAAMHRGNTSQAVKRSSDYRFHFDRLVLRIDDHDHWLVRVGCSLGNGLSRRLRRRRRRWGSFLVHDRHWIFDSEFEGKVRNNFTISGHASVEPERGILGQTQGDVAACSIEIVSTLMGQGTRKINLAIRGLNGYQLMVHPFKLDVSANRRSFKTIALIVRTQV